MNTSGTIKISKLPSDFPRYKEIFVVQCSFGNKTICLTQTSKPNSGEHMGAVVYFRVRPKKSNN